MSKHEQSYETSILNAWEQIVKKGWLTFWILLSLVDEPLYMSEILEFINEESNGKIKPEEQSLYRALRRFLNSEIIEVEERRESNQGAMRKYYSLTPIGGTVLSGFIKGTVIPLHSARLQKIYKKVIKEKV